MIYFIRSGTRPYVKIGFCNGDPLVRMATLQVGSVEQLALIGSVEGGCSEERKWHARFAYLRVRGEWFEFSPELQRAIGVALGDADPPADGSAKALAHLQRFIDAGKEPDRRRGRSPA